jgi:hypothetical protein
MAMKSRRTAQRACALLLLTTAATVVVAQTVARKPAIPPGAPTRGLAVGVLLDGLDYTKPAVASRLARDGEGVAIAYDAVDDDARPYGTDAATEALVMLAPTLVVPIRVAASPDAAARAFGFVRRSPARVVVVLSPLAADVLTREATVSTDRLMIVPANDSTKLALANVLTVAALPLAGARAVRADHADIVLAPASASREAPGGASAGPATAREAAMLATGLLACLDLTKARTPADVIAAIVARGATGAAGTAPLVEFCSRRF